MSNLTCNRDTLIDGGRWSVDEIDDDVRIVCIGGELDTAVREVVTRFFTGGDQRNVVVDLANLTFMDCGGYRALVDASNLLGDCSASLTVVNATGEPARLLELVGVNQSIGTSRTSQITRRNP